MPRLFVSHFTSPGIGSDLKTKITAKSIAGSNYTTEWLPKDVLSADLTVFLQLAGGPFKRLLA
jgi:hypothetical protein